MATFRVTSEELGTTGALVEQKAGEVQDMLTQLQGRVSTLMQSWEGSASAAYNQKFDEWKSGAAQVHEAMVAIGGFLKTAGIQYAETEENIRSTIGG